MGRFLKSLGNILTIALTILGLVALILSKLELNSITLSAILFIIIFIGFVSVVIYYILKLEKQIDLFEETYKRDKDLFSMKSDINLLKMVVGGEIAEWKRKAK